MVVIFFGTPQFAVPTLDALLASSHSVVAVVTQPDRPRGRGQRTTDAPVKAHALAAAIPVLQPTSLKDPAVVADLTALRADIGVVAAYGKILTEAVLATPRLGMVNVHASLLPRYRGAAPIHRAVIAGERETGVTIMRVVRALDAGAMMATVKRPIGADETSEDVERALSRLGATLLVETLDRLASAPVLETPQDDSASTYASRLTKEDGIVQWDRSAIEIHNQIRGLHPWPHAYAFVGGRRVILWRSSVTPSVAPAVAPSPTSSAEALVRATVVTPTTEHPVAGEIIQADGDELLVATGDGTLRILELQAEGKRSMAPREFLAGQRLAKGDRFSASA